PWREQIRTRFAELGAPEATSLALDAYGQKTFEADLSTWMKVAERGTGNSNASWILNNLAKAQLRAGLWDHAIANCQRSLKAQPNWGGHVLNWSVLALAHHHRGQTDEAQRWFKKAD